MISQFVSTVFIVRGGSFAVISLCFETTAHSRSDITNYKYVAGLIGSPQRDG
jgi:hypothetical protein